MEQRHSSKQTEREVLNEQLAVLGSPIAHSKSPGIHLAAYEKLALDWSYERQQLEADELEPWLASRGEYWRGFSLTMPLKEEAHRLATVLDPVAEESGVVNTLLRIASDTSGTPRWAGFNTDVAGLAQAISKAGLDATRTVVIGSGATAISAILAARKLGAEHVEILARNIPVMSDLVAKFSGTSEPGSSTVLKVDATNLLSPESVILEGQAPPTLVISTLPGHASAEIKLTDTLTQVPLFDVAYDPWPSPLGERWRAAGGVAHAGTAMLVEQALVQVRIFVGGDSSIPLTNEADVLAAMVTASVGG